MGLVSVMLLFDYIEFFAVYWIVITRNVDVNSIFASLRACSFIFVSLVKPIRTIRLYILYAVERTGLTGQI